MADAVAPAAPAAQPNGAAPKSTVAPVTPPAGGIDVAKPPPAGATVAEKRAYKLLVDGREESFEGTDADIQRELQKARGAERRFEEAKRLRAEARAEKEALAERLRKDPWALLREHGVDPDEAMAARLAESIQAAQLTPEQRELRELKSKLEATEKEKLSAAEKQKAVELERAADAEWQKMEPELFKAMDNYPDLPRTRGTQALIGKVGLEFLEAGIDLKPADIIAEAYERHQKSVTGRIRSAPLGLLKSWLTPEQRLAIAKDVAQEQKAKRPGGAAANDNAIRDEPAANDNARQSRRPKAEPEVVTSSQFLKSLKGRR